jgi:hypothetical protein
MCAAASLIVRSKNRQLGCADKKVVLVYESPSFNINCTIELLSPSVRYTPGRYIAMKITWLIDIVSQSKNGGLVTECSQCGKRYTGQDGDKNRKRHMRSCRFTENRLVYQCPDLDCGETFNRSDNLHAHIRIRHPGERP